MQDAVLFSYDLRQKIIYKAQTADLIYLFLFSIYNWQSYLPHIFVFQLILRFLQRVACFLQQAWSTY